MARAFSPYIQETVERQSRMFSKSFKIKSTFKTQSNFSGSNLQPIFKDTAERQWLERSAHFQTQSNFNSSKVQPVFKDTVELQRHEHSVHLSSYNQTSMTQTFSSSFKIQSKFNGLNIHVIMRFCSRHR